MRDVAHERKTRHALCEMEVLHILVSRAEETFSFHVRKKRSLGFDVHAGSPRVPVQLKVLKSCKGKSIGLGITQVRYSGAYSGRVDHFGVAKRPHSGHPHPPPWILVHMVIAASM